MEEGLVKVQMPRAVMQPELVTGTHTPLSLVWLDPPRR